MRVFGGVRGWAMGCTMMAAIHSGCRTTQTHPFAQGTAKVEDVFMLPSPASVRLGGLLGDRFAQSEKNRLLRVDEEELIEGFRHRPGKQAWIGEHVGKWMHAASLAYANTGDPELRAKLDRVARELIKTQEIDGYLGRYIPEQRFGQFKHADWDVWVHKYNLIGLLNYYHVTGNKRALAASRKIGDLLIRTFGPDRKSIISAGTHVGMAATSVLEPVVQLYRTTGDERYLVFAKYIAEAYDDPGGPHILKTLMEKKSVLKTANKKAYEMLSNLVGLCELYRATGDRRYLDPVLFAWDDIVKNRLYITGSGSNFEHWQADHHLPNGNNDDVAETCVTVTWEQLNIQLLRLTGGARFADQLERTVYNHLLAAQKPDGTEWCYFTPLEGKKEYRRDTNCCLSSGPRGVALISTFAYASTKDGVVVNLFDESSAVLPVGGGEVQLSQKTSYPFSDTTELTLNPKGAGAFDLRLRMPAWTSAAGIAINGGPEKVEEKPGDYVVLRREWKEGDIVQYQLRMPPRLILGDHDNDGRAAIEIGPLVLAADLADHPDINSATRIGIASDDPAKFTLRSGNSTSDWEMDGFVLKNGGMIEKKPIRLRPFYATGTGGSRYVVWLRRPGSTETKRGGVSLLSFAEESRSRAGNAAGRIADDDFNTFVVTFSGKEKIDWFAVASEVPVTINRILFAHGRTFHDGGWFDTSEGKPRAQVQKKPQGEWEDIATLDEYPDTTATNHPKLKNGQAFSVKFPAVVVYGVRIIGKPACGDEPSGAFSSCAELQVFFED